MAVDGTGSSTDSSALQSLSSNYTMFLKLLTTQLQNQDPLSPTDSTTFTQQLVAYSQVEQQIKTNDNLSTLITNTQAISNSGATLLNYLGKSVEVNGDSFSLQNSVANMTYQLASAATNVKLEITDSTGATVATFTGPGGAGVQKISWDGKNSSNTQYSDGIYKLKITATDSSGNSIAVSSQTAIGTVTGVERGSSGTLLDMGKQQVKESDVLNIYTTASGKV